MSDQAANLTASGLFTTSAGAFNSTLPVIMVRMSTFNNFGLNFEFNVLYAIIIATTSCNVIYRRQNENIKLFPEASKKLNNLSQTKSLNHSHLHVPKGM